MKISKTSWHYRLYRYISSIPKDARYLNPFTLLDRPEPELPKSLCPYAWSIFLGLLGTFFLILLLIAFSWLVAAWFVCVGIFQGAKRLDAKLFTRSKPGLMPPPPAPAPREKKPSLAAAYLKARKEKVCPTITLVD